MKRACVIEEQARNTLHFLSGGGSTGKLIRSFDWQQTHLGAVETWPQSLRTAVSLMLGGAQPVYIAWGPELSSLYNDAYLPIVGTKHSGIGLPFRELWSEIWDEFRPIVEKTLAGDAQHFVDMPIALTGRPGVPVGYFTFSYTALRDDDGNIAGFYCAATETTDKVLAEQRTRAEAALRAREEQLRLAIENAEIGFWDVDVVNDVLVWSGRTKGMFGILSDIPTTLRDFYEGLHPEDREVTSAAYAAAADPVNRPLYDVEYRTVGKEDGVVRWVAAKGRGVFDEAGRCLRVAGTAIDITARKAAERALIENEAQSRRNADEINQIYATAPIGLCVLDRELRYQRINSHLAAINGTSAEAHIGKTVREILPDLADECERIAAQVFATGEPVVGIEISGMTDAKRGELRHWLAQWAPVKDASGVVAGISVVAEEITERKAAEATLRESQARQSILIESWAQAVWETDAHGVVIADSPSWRAFTGQTLQEWLGYGWLDAIHPDDRVDAERQWQEATAAHGLVNAEFRLRAPDGGWRWTNVRAAPVLDEKGGIAKWAGMNIDITLRKQAEEHAQLLMAEVNHRAKNLLSVVQAVAQQTASSGDPLTFTARLSDRISGLAANQDLLVKNLWHGVEVNELVRSQLAHFKNLIGTRIFLNGPESKVTAAASQAIGMAVHELATNAVKYGALSNANGQVHVEWQLTAGPDSQFLMSWRESDGPPVKAPTRKGFGQTVIKRLVESSVDGDVKVDYSEIGFSWHLGTAAANVLVNSRGVMNPNDNAR